MVEGVEEWLEGGDAACHDGELDGADGEDVGDYGGDVRVGVEGWSEVDEAECDDGNKSNVVRCGVVEINPTDLH